MRNKFVKNQNLDAIKFCFGRDSNLAEGGLRFLFEDQEKPDVILNKFWTNFSSLANSSKSYFPNLMGSIPRDMKLRFQTVEDLEELQNIYSSFNQFSQVFQNVCEEVNDLVSSKSDDENLKDAIPNLREVVKGNFIPDKSLNTRFEIFKKKLAGYIGDDYDFADRKKKQPPLLQKIVAAVIDAFIANPKSAAGTDKNLRLIFGGKLASDLMYRDLSNLTVGKFKKGYSEFIDEYNRIAGALLVPKMDAPEENTEDKKSAPEEKTGAAPEEKTAEKAGAAPEEKTAVKTKSRSKNKKTAVKTKSRSKNKKTAEKTGAVPAPEEKTAEKAGAAPEEKTGAVPASEEKKSEEKNLWDMISDRTGKSSSPELNKINKHLDNLSRNWREIRSSPDEIYKSDFLNDIKGLRDAVSGMKLERKNLKSQDLIVERWIKMTGLEDEHE